MPGWGDIDRATVAAGNIEAMKTSDSLVLILAAAVVSFHIAAEIKDITLTKICINQRIGDDFDRAWFTNAHKEEWFGLGEEWFGLGKTVGRFSQICFVILCLVAVFVFGVLGFAFVFALIGEDGPGQARHDGRGIIKLGSDGALGLPFRTWTIIWAVDILMLIPALVTLMDAQSAVDTINHADDTSEQEREALRESSYLRVPFLYLDTLRQYAFVPAIASSVPLLVMFDGGDSEYQSQFLYHFPTLHQVSHPALILLQRRAFVSTRLLSSSCSKSTMKPSTTPWVMAPAYLWKSLAGQGSTQKIYVRNSQRSGWPTWRSCLAP